MAEPTVPRPAVENFSRTDFRTLSFHRDAMAYYCVGCLKEALGYLNLGETEKAQRALLSGLDLFQRADNAVNNFTKENQHGNAAA